MKTTVKLRVTPTLAEERRQPVGAHRGSGPLRDPEEAVPGLVGADGGAVLLDHEREAVGGRDESGGLGERAPASFQAEHRVRVEPIPHRPGDGTGGQGPDGGEAGAHELGREELGLVEQSVDGGTQSVTAVLGCRADPVESDADDNEHLGAHRRLAGRREQREIGVAHRLVGLGLRRLVEVGVVLLDGSGRGELRPGDARRRRRPPGTGSRGHRRRRRPGRPSRRSPRAGTPRRGPVARRRPSRRLGQRRPRSVSPPGRGAWDRRRRGRCRRKAAGVPVRATGSSAAE